MKYQIKAQSFNRKTNKATSEISEEIIDTKSNVIFYGLKNSKEVKETFEDYWDINPTSEEIVRIQKIQILGKK